MHEYEAGFVGLKALADHLAISIRSIHRLVASGALPSVKIGRRRVVSRDAIKDWLSDNEAQQVAR